MGSVTIRVGPSDVGRKMDCFPVGLRRGLVAHASTNVERRKELVTFTHAKSGYSVIQHVPESAVHAVVAILSEVNWDLPVEEIAQSAEHFPRVLRAMREVRRMARVHKESARQEDEIARDLGGRRQPASGSRWGYRRDVITPELLIEAKTTSAKTYRLVDKDLAYLTKQAYKQGKIPVYAIEIQQRPNVMVIPTDELASDCFNNALRKSVDARRKKSYGITVELADWLNAGGAMTIQFPSGFYTALGYEKFLELAKRGLDG